MYNRGALPCRAALTGWAIRSHLSFKGKRQALHHMVEQQLHAPVWVQYQVDGKQMCRKGTRGPGGQAGHELDPWAHKYRRDKGTLKQVQQRHTKMIKGLEHLSDKERLSEFRLFSLEESKLGGGE